MTPRKYLMISALSKQMEEVKSQAAKDVSKFNIENPHMHACEEKSRYCGYGKREFLGYKSIAEIPQDIAEEVLTFYKQLQTMKADEIYAAVLKKLLNEAKDMNGESEK